MRTGRGWRGSIARISRWIAGVISGANNPPEFTATTTVTVSFNLGTGSTFNVASYVTDADNDTIIFSTNDVTLPTGVTFGSDGTFTYDGTGSTPTTVGGLVIYANDGESDTIANFMLSSSLGGVVPFKFGQVYARGAVPQGQTVLAEGTKGFQTDVKNRHSDGSILFAIHTGRVSVSTGALVSLALKPATSVSLTPLGESDLQAVAPVVCVAMGGYGDIVLSDLIGVSSSSVRGSNGRLRTFIAGPEYSEWHYYAQVTTADPHLYCMIYAGLWKDNSLRLQIEAANGHWLVSAPGERQYRYTIKTGGSVAYDQWMYTSETTAATGISATAFQKSGDQSRNWKRGQRVLVYAASAGTSVFGTIVTVGVSTNTSVILSVDSGSVPASIQHVRTLGHPHHTRWVRDLWYSADPRVTYKHDVSVLRASKVFPNYGYTSASGGQFASYKLTNDGPFIRHGYQEDMGSTGFDQAIGLFPQWEAHYLAGGDPRALKYALVNAAGHGRYLIHYRDENTLKPVRPESYPTYGYEDNTLTGAGVYHCTTVTPTPSGTNFPSSMSWEGAHHPNTSFLAYMATGDYPWMEETQFLATFNIMMLNDVTRGGATPKLQVVPAQGRFKAWQQRSIALAARATPDGEQLQTSYVSCLSHTHAADLAFWVSGSGSNDLGIIAASPGSYTDVVSVYEDAPWQNDFNTAVQGYISDLGLPYAVSASATQLALRNFAYKHTVGRMGGLGNGEYCYRRVGQYNLRYGSPEETPPPSNWYTWDQVYQNTLTSVTCVRGEALLDSGTDSPEGFATGYWANAMPAFAYAVEHEASGAVSAWNLVTSASNWLTLSQGFHNQPIWGLRPRNQP